MSVNLLARLSASPTDHRHALAILDPEYHEWRPQGRPKHRIDDTAGVPLLIDETSKVFYVLGGLSPSDAAAVASFVSKCAMTELNVVGREAFGLLRPYLASSGQWRHSRNYEATADAFVPRLCGGIRRLGPADGALLEAAQPALAGSRSMLRDFAYMADGLPVVCYGAVVDGRLVGFRSANPICNRVYEISWVVVADGYRRRGIASGLITAHAVGALARGERVAYYAGSAGDDLDEMLRGLGFREAKGSYRFVPYSTAEQWRASWGVPV
jgi:GNAT superfamily N-acetyltransferase